MRVQIDQPPGARNRRVVRRVLVQPDPHKAPQRQRVRQSRRNSALTVNALEIADQQREKQEDIWIAHTELALAPGHPFYQRLNELLEAEGFDEFVEGRCAKFYAAKYGRGSTSVRRTHCHVRIL